MAQERRNWVLQTRVSSSHPRRLLTRTNYLSDLWLDIEKSLRDYHDRVPEGTDFTREAARCLGEGRIMQHIDHNHAFDTIKKDFGLLIPQRLVEVFKPENGFVVSTDRYENMRNRSLQNKKDENQGTEWLKNYTRHQVRKLLS